MIEALQEYNEWVHERNHPLSGREYASLTQPNAGTKENLIPENTVITVDRRFSPDRSIKDVDAETKEVLARIIEEHGVTIDWEWTQLSGLQRPTQTTSLRKSYVNIALQPPTFRQNTLAQVGPATSATS